MTIQIHKFEYQFYDLWDNVFVAEGGHTVKMFLYRIFILEKPFSPTLQQRADKLGI